MLVEEAEQKDLEEEESASEASEIMSSDNKSSEDNAITWEKLDLL